MTGFREGDWSRGSLGTGEPEGHHFRRVVRANVENERVEGRRNRGDLPKYVQGDERLQADSQAQVGGLGRRYRCRVDRVHEHRDGRQQGAHLGVERTHRLRPDHENVARNREHEACVAGHRESRGCDVY